MLYIDSSTSYNLLKEAVRRIDNLDIQVSLVKRHDCIQSTVVRNCPHGRASGEVTHTELHLLQGEYAFVLDNLNLCLQYLMFLNEQGLEVKCSECKET